ncbi:MAG: hypothetical protein JXA50_09625 [Deltaproteobacteria bacterium]|nr:hypothetical protein [Deltaproteobacteria bacterium]
MTAKHDPGKDLQAVLGTSPRNPAPLGVTIKTKIERGDAYAAPEIYDIVITLLEIVRGEEALQRVKEAGVMAEPPPNGFEYFLVRLTFGYSRRGRGIGEEPYQLRSGQFAAVSADGETVYKNPVTARQPQPPLIGEVFQPGESREGWIVLQVPQEESKPLLIFNREFVEGVYGLWGHVWFQLSEA